jgi:spore maturation protein B
MIDLLTSMPVPLILAVVGIYALGKRVNVYEGLICGAGEGVKTLARIAPALIALLTAVYMLRSSGAMELAADALSPVLKRLGIPAETVGLMLVRPVSGSGALGVGAELMETYGPDSYIGRVAAVMLGSTETTFYAIAAYFGAARVSGTRYVVPAALCADLVGFCAAAWAVRLFFGTGG